MPSPFSVFQRHCQHEHRSQPQYAIKNTLIIIENLEILSLARNQIKRIQGLDEVGPTLLELWLSHNQIEKLEGIQSCVKLTTLYISHNKIKSWDEVSRLSQLPSLKDLLLSDNPVYGDKDKEAVKPYAIKRVPALEILDGKVVTEAVRAQAKEIQE